jgi:hypothetical protein
VLLEVALSQALLEAAPLEAVLLELVLEQAAPVLAALVPPRRQGHLLPSTTKLRAQPGQCPASLPASCVASLPATLPLWKTPAAEAVAGAGSAKPVAAIPAEG